MLKMLVSTLKPAQLFALQVYEAQCRQISWHYFWISGLLLNSFVLNILKPWSVCFFCMVFFFFGLFLIFLYVLLCMYVLLCAYTMITWGPLRPTVMCSTSRLTSGADTPREIWGQQFYQAQCCNPTILPTRFGPWSLQVDWSWGVSCPVFTLNPTGLAESGSDLGRKNLVNLKC